MKEKIGLLLIAAGLLIIAGAAGAYENEAYTMYRFITWAAAGVVVMLTGSRALKHE